MDSNCKGFSSFKEDRQCWAFLRHFSLKRLAALHWFLCLFFAYKSKISEAHGHDCLNCKHLPNVCKFLLVLKAQILDTAFSSGVERCRSKTFSILSILGFALRSTPSLHNYFIIHPVLFILCLILVKRVVSSNHSSCIYHPFIHQISNLLCVSHVMSYLFL